MNATQHTPVGPPLLAVHGITKKFSGVRALRGVNFDLYRGEVHAVVGENGAGKSTLMYVLTGVCRPDSGTISIEGIPCTIRSKRMAQALGISIVYQERSLFPQLSIAENIFAALQPVSRWGIIDRRRLNKEAGQLLSQVGLDIDPRMPVDRLSPALQQMVEIAKALALDSEILIFDEPTAALSKTETDVLFQLIARLQSRNAGIIYISHRLEEIFRIAGRVTVLKDGEGMGTMPVSQTSPEDLVRRMVGRAAELDRSSDTGPNRRVVLEVRHLSDCVDPVRENGAVNDVSFEAHEGEILVFAGLAGSGRTALALSIFGARPRRSGDIMIDGHPIDIRTPEAAVAAGVGYVPEERQEQGIFAGMSVAENMDAAHVGCMGRWRVDDRERNLIAEQYIRDLGISTPGPSQKIQYLSGGNQQKVVLARWLRLRPKILIVDEPTRGIDVGAKQEVHRLLRRLAGEGTAVIVISSDLPEVLTIADRILVMRNGRIAGALDHRNATEERILQLAAIDPNRSNPMH